MRDPLASAATSLHTAGSRPEDCHLSKFFKGNTLGIWHAYCYLQMQMIQPSCASYGADCGARRLTADARVQGLPRTLSGE